MQKNRAAYWSAAPDPQRRELMGDLNDARASLLAAYTSFDHAVEPELIEASIYEINAQRARCSYLIRRLKEHGAEGASAWR